MSKRMSRREKREAGLLKPKPAPELPEDAEFRPSGGGDHLRPEDRDTRDDGGPAIPEDELITPPSPTSAPEAAEPGADVDDDVDAGEPTAAWPAVSASSAGEADEAEIQAEAPHTASPAAPHEEPADVADPVATSAETVEETEVADDGGDRGEPHPAVSDEVEQPVEHEPAEDKLEDEPVADQPAGAVEDSADTPAPSATSDEPEAMSAVAADHDGPWANVNAAGSGVTLDATGDEQSQAPSAQAPSAPSAEAEDLERPSVFDRFTSDEETDPSNREELATEEGDEDFAASLRQRLRDEPPVEDGGYATEQIDVAAQPTESSSASSIVKNVLLFLILIVVGFGLGILIGTYLWGSNSEAVVDVAETMWPLLT